MKAIVISLRVTGLMENASTRPERQPELIAFAAIGFDWNEPIKVSYSYQASIKPKQWRRGLFAAWKSFAAHAETIRPLLEDANIVVGHQLASNVEMIDLEFSRLGRRIKWPRLKICIMEQSVHLAGRQLELRELHERLIGRKYKNDGHVMARAVAIHNCLSEMRRRDWV
jgi:hypothetical protein